MAATLEESIKTTLRLSSAATLALSNEINRQISTARMEMKRVGITDTVSSGDTELVDNAIITFALMNMGPKDMRESYKESWECQINNIRKAYKWEGEQET